MMLLRVRFKMWRMFALLGLLVGRHAFGEGKPRLVDRPAEYGGGLVVFSPDHRLLAIREEDGSLRLVNFKSGATTGFLTTGHQGMGSGVAFSPDGRWIATGGWMDKTLRIWDVQTSRQLSQLEVSRCTDVAFSPDGRTLVTGQFGEKLIGLMFWEVSRAGTLKLSKEIDLGTLSKYPQTIHNLRYSPDGRWVAFGSENVHVVDTRSGVVRIFGRNVKRTTITAFLFFTDRGWLVSAHRSGKLIIWNIIDGSEAFQLENSLTRITSTARIPGTNTILISTESNTVAAIDLKARRVATENLNPKLPARLNHFNNLILSDDALGLAVCADKWVYLFDVHDLTPPDPVDDNKP